MLKIRIESRGGQGGKTAGQLLAETAVTEGKHVQAYSEYGPERCGAPVKTYIRIANKPIKTYEPVSNPDVVIVIDTTLMATVKVSEGLTSKGILIINSDKEPKFVKTKIRFKGKVHTVDATKISTNLLGRNIPNTAMLGALLKITKIVTLKNLNEKIREHFTKKLGEEKTKANTKAVEKAYEEVR